MKLENTHWILPLLQKVQDGWTLEEYTYDNEWERILNTDSVAFDRGQRYYRVIPPKPQYRLYKHKGASVASDFIHVAQRYTPCVVKTPLIVVEKKVAEGAAYWITDWLDLPAGAYSPDLFDDSIDPV